jgi:quinol monooxygenase YgiN
VVKVFITYKLNDDVTREQYREWSRAVDQPMASRQPGVLKYEIYEIEGSRGDERPYDVIEVIEAESREAWEAVNDRPEMKEAVAQFFEIAKRGSVSVTYGHKIEP